MVYNKIFQLVYKTPSCQERKERIIHNMTCSQKFYNDTYQVNIHLVQNTNNKLGILFKYIRREW